MTLAILKNTLRHAGPAAIAVSGGVDSLTLACIAAPIWPESTVFHAVSPAVPRSATDRVRRFAQDRNWNLQIIDAAEFSDPDYRRNPVNRCFYCKSNLYARIAEVARQPIFSGTNLDDLNDFRPGLDAARNFGVRHPFVEVNVRKSGIRNFAREFGLGEVADLPASPCLASRVMTGLRIEPEELRTIDSIESGLRKAVGNVPVRCRRTHKGYQIQIDAAVLERMGHAERDAALSCARRSAGTDGTILGLAPYVRGSAFRKGAGHE